MRTIGFAGGSSNCELGSVSDVQLFFACVNKFVEEKHPEHPVPLIAERLYRRYLRLEELDESIRQMEYIKEVFSKHLNKDVDWSHFKYGPDNTRLDPHGATLDVIFSKYFEHFGRCIEQAKLDYATFSKQFPTYKYQPVRTIACQLPLLALDKSRTLEDYDRLEGEPFWLRPNEELRQGLKMAARSVKP